MKFRDVTDGTSSTLLMAEALFGERRRIWLLPPPPESTEFVQVCGFVQPVITSQPMGFVHRIAGCPMCCMMVILSQVAAAAESSRFGPSFIAGGTECLEWVSTRVHFCWAILKTVPDTFNWGVPGKFGFGWELVVDW